MFELDFLVLVEILFVALVIYGAVTQIIIPLKKNKRLFPYFMKASEKLLDEVEQINEEELQQKLRRARAAKRQAEIEQEIFEAQHEAEEKRQQLRRGQKQ